MLGYGYQAYFTTLRWLVFAFATMTLVISPAYFFYGKYEGITHLSNQPYFLQHTLGNMGFNKAVCNSIYVRNGQAKASQIKCEVGVI